MTLSIDLASIAAIFGTLDRDPLAAEFGHERISVRWISKAKADVIGYRLAAQIGASLVGYRARVTELVHCHQPRNEAADRNKGPRPGAEKSLSTRRLVTSPFALGHDFLGFVLRPAVANGGALLAYLRDISIRWGSFFIAQPNLNVEIVAGDADTRE